MNDTRDQFLSELKQRVLRLVGDANSKFLVFSELVDGYQATLILYHLPNDEFLKSLNYDECVFDIIDHAWDLAQSDPTQESWGVLKFLYSSGGTETEFLEESHVDIENSGAEKNRKIAERYFPGLKLKAV